ncbi:OmpA family protein [Celerinatantimonas sp. YJH-8]|uniref:OmpA family protein n=1 Tax=Celerinatantimonas sp. YJH-8 TaxID=3228714 RepID=UPI0038C8EDF2
MRIKPLYYMASAVFVVMGWGTNIAIASSCHPITVQSYRVGESYEGYEVKKLGSHSVLVDTASCPGKSVLMVHFGFNQVGLSSSEKAKIDRALQAVKQGTELKIHVTGYTDAIGPNRYNQQLGMKRAQMVKAYLSQHGLAADAIMISSAGETLPVATNQTEQGRALNRRADIMLQ